MRIELTCNSVWKYRLLSPYSRYHQKLSARIHRELKIWEIHVTNIKSNCFVLLFDTYPQKDNCHLKRTWPMLSEMWWSQIHVWSHSEKRQRSGKYRRQERWSWKRKLWLPIPSRHQGPRTWPVSHGWAFWQTVPITPIPERYMTTYQELSTSFEIIY